MCAVRVLLGTGWRMEDGESVDGGGRREGEGDERKGRHRAEGRGGVMAGEGELGLLVHFKSVFIKLITRKYAGDKYPSSSVCR